MNHSEPLPEGWRWMRLSEVCAGTENRDPTTTPDLPFRYVDISSVDNRSKRIMATSTILGKDAPSRARQIIKANDVIVAATRPNLNAVALVTEELDNEICSTGFCVLRPTEDLNSLFLYFFVQTKYFIDTISGEVRGMLYPAVTEKQIREIHIPVPNLSEQKRIAAKIQELMQEVDNARTACEKQLAAAKALPSAYLREAFESEEGKKWERKRLADVCEIVKGKKPTLYNEPVDENSLSYLTAEVIRSGKTSEWCLVSDKNSVAVQEHEIIMIADGSNSGEVFTGFKGVLASTMGKLRIDEEKISKDFLYYFIKMNFEELNKPKRGAAIPHLEKEIFFNLSIPLPLLSIQQSIAAELKEKMAKAENLQSSIRNQLSTIEAMPQSILRKAFRGELTKGN